MYLDTTGNVTIGIGNMLPSKDASQALPFVNRTTKNAAKKEEIAKDFDEVAKQKSGHPAKSYIKYTALDLPDVEINKLFQARIAEFVKLLRKHYPKYDSYPDAAQLALLDMAFNLGASGLKKDWPKLNKNIDDLDWAAAAGNCNRPDVQVTRNSAVKELFVKAGKDAATAAGQTKGAVQAGGKPAAP